MRHGPDPNQDHFFLNIEKIATTGSEHGPIYDQGVLFVTKQVREKGYFDPHPIVLATIPEVLPQLTTPEERAEIDRLLTSLGLTLETGVQFARGAHAGQSYCSKYKKPKDDE